MNTRTKLLLALTASLAVFAVGCGDSTVMTIDGGGHPDLGMRDAGTDAGGGSDAGVDLGTTPTDGGTDLGPTDGGGGPTDLGTYLTDAGCWEGVPSTMVQFLNHCTTRSTPAAVTGSGIHSTLVYADGGVPPIP